MLSVHQIVQQVTPRINVVLLRIQFSKKLIDIPEVSIFNIALA